MLFLPLNFISKAFSEAFVECTNGQLTYGKGGKNTMEERHYLQ